MSTSVAVRSTNVTNGRGDGAKLAGGAPHRTPATHIDHSLPHNAQMRECS